MARLENLPEPMRSHIADLPCPEYDATPWVKGPEMSAMRVALVSTAGLHLRGDRPFTGMDGNFRVIDGTSRASDLVMTHISTNFDRTGFQQDWNVVFPIDRLQEMADKDRIGSVAGYHYSFMGAASPEKMAPSAKNLAGLLKADNVDAALLIPV